MLYARIQRASVRVSTLADAISFWNENRGNRLMGSIELDEPATDAQLGRLPTALRELLR